MLADNPVHTTPMIDLVFTVRGESVPADYHDLLAGALRAALPWLDDEPEAGVHGLRTAPAREQIALLPRRARLTLRVPESRVDDVRGLEGRALTLGIATLLLSDLRAKPLVAANTVYADIVTLGEADEMKFVEALQAELDALGVAARHICGRARSLTAQGRRLDGYPVALHDLKPAASLRVQHAGIGGARMLGCGVFVPHKAITGLE